MTPAGKAERLYSAESAAALDAEASASWGLNPFALVEAAGRSCAHAYRRLFPAGKRITVLAGPGNNAADAMVMLRTLIIGGYLQPEQAAVILSREGGAGAQGEASLSISPSVRDFAVRSLEALGVSFQVWGGADGSGGVLSAADLVIDGIAGTGIRSPLRGNCALMAEALDRRRGDVKVVSIDIPSGCGDFFTSGDICVKADITLAIEPLKTALYIPSLRCFAGKIVPVRGIFPQKLIGQRADAFLRRWDEAALCVPAVPGDSYKYSRGLVEIHAGSPGSYGAARIASAGAQAAGAGLVRLAVDAAIYPAMAASAGGVMVFAEAVPDTAGGASQGRFKADALLLGPGWGRGADRMALLEKAFESEAAGTPLILDADAIALAKGRIFHGNAILTPHPGEFEYFSGIPKAEILDKPRLLGEIAEKTKAVILFKSHVMIIAAPGQPLQFVDGMEALLACGGSGDLLAGFCAALAARIKAMFKRSSSKAENGNTGAGKDGADNPRAMTEALAGAAGAAASLLICAAKRRGRVFTDPLELAESAACAAGELWLGTN